MIRVVRTVFKDDACWKHKLLFAIPCNLPKTGAPCSSVALYYTWECQTCRVHEVVVEEL